MTSLRERALRLEREQDLLVAQARIQERTRIAREMHDVLAHRVSLMVLHANALGVAHETQRAELTRRIGTIGRAALEELQRLVGVLKDSGEAAPLTPQPGIDDLTQLAEQSRAAGIAVTLEFDALPERLPALVEHACYRLVQESLTNVHKHAADAPTHVQLGCVRGTLQLTITNAPPARPGANANGLPRGGHGLVGLRERVGLLGGHLVAEPTPDGGFRLEAAIPLHAQEVGPDARQGGA